MICGGPPPMSTRFSFPSSKYAIERLSADQNGWIGRPLTIGCGVTEFNDSPTMLAALTLEVIQRPSGDTVIGAVPAGSVDAMNRTSGGSGARANRAMSDGTSAAASNDATATPIQTARSFFRVAVVGA